MLNFTTLLFIVPRADKSLASSSQIVIALTMNKTTSHSPFLFFGFLVFFFTNRTQIISACYCEDRTLFGLSCPRVDF